MNMKTDDQTQNLAIFTFDDYKNGVKNLGEKLRLLEWEWRSTSPRIADGELLKIFPTARRVVLRNIKEWEEKRDIVTDIIRKKLALINEKTTDEFSRWFAREWLKTNEGEMLLAAVQHLARLKRYLVTSKSRTPEGRITDEMIEKARGVPIVEIAASHLQQLKKVGGNFIAICPFHAEKHPSFYLYSQTNSFYCFSCQEGGDVLTLAMLLNNFDFKQAVIWLNNY